MDTLAFSIKQMLMTGFGFLLFLSMGAQDEHAQKAIQQQIKSLTAQQKITAINDLIKDNPSLPPSYVLEVLTQNLATAKAEENRAAQATTLIVLGNFWFQQGDRIKAYDHLLDAESLIRKLNNQNLLGTLLLNKANASSTNSLKINTYQEAITIFKQQKNWTNLSKSYLNLAGAYTGVVFSGNLNGVKSVLSSKDSIHYKSLAFTYLKKADSINAYIDNETISGITKIHMAEWYKMEKDYEEAKRLFKETQAILAKSGHPKGETYSTLHLASIAIKQSNFEEALHYLKKAEKMASTYNYLNYLQGVYDEYVKVYDSIGEYQKALQYSRLYTQASVELYKANSEDRILALSLEHQQKENEYKLSEYEAKHQLNQVLLYVSIALLILTTGIAYLMIKNKKRKVAIYELEKDAIEIKLNNKKLEEALLKEKVKFSQEQLISFANQVNKIEAFIEKLKEHVKRIPLTQETKETINSLKLSLYDILSGKNYLKQLNTFTTKLNQEFFFYVSKHYDNISEDDQQLLSYIILDRSANEISEILNISSSSVYTKRYRLRQKLQMEKEESFTDFYDRIMEKMEKIEKKAG